MSGNVTDFNFLGAIVFTNVCSKVIFHLPSLFLDLRSCLTFLESFENICFSFCFSPSLYTIFSIFSVCSYYCLRLCLSLDCNYFSVSCNTVTTVTNIFFSLFLSPFPFLNFLTSFLSHSPFPSSSSFSFPCFPPLYPPPLLPHPLFSALL